MKNRFGECTPPVSGAVLGRRFREGSVAGFDLTFSPAKSVSTLWAVAPPDVAKQIRLAHNAAVLDALDFLETHAIFTREGSGGARQVEARGLIAAARSEEHTSELQSLMRISYAVFCLKKKNT